MITKIDNSVKFVKRHGGFGIEILYPGLIKSESKDTGIGGIGRIDQAKITPGTMIPMHPHRDDEILTYTRSGKVKHLDSEEITEILSNKKLMMMNAGARIYHEETVLQEGGTLEGLQIFIRPEKAALPPKVQFYDLPEIYSLDQWRNLAGKGENYPLEIRSNTWIKDLRLQKGNRINLPDADTKNAVVLFYVFSGEVQVNNDMVLKTGESILIEDDNPDFEALETSDVVLFITDKNSTYFEKGMYSGNQK